MLASIGRADGRSRMFGHLVFQDNPNLRDVPVERMTCVLYGFVIGCTKIFHSH